MDRAKSFGLVKQGFPSIEGLRAYMAWWVVIGHGLQLCGTLAWLDPRLASLILLGDTAVNVFIIISGFVITHLLLTKQEHYGAYITRRVFRIAPIYAVCLVIAMLTVPFYKEIFIDFPWASHAPMRMERLLETDKNWWTHLALHATMLHGVVPESVLRFSSSTFLSPAWSLSLEWQFYLLAPLLIGTLSRSLRSFSVGAVLLLAVGWVSHRLLASQYLYPSMLLLSIQWFLVGIGSRLAVEHIRHNRARMGMVFAAMLVCVVAAKSKEMLIWALFFAFALFETRDDPTSHPMVAALVRALGSNRLLSLLGKVSYSSYLVHIPLFAVVGHVWAATLGMKSQQDMVKALLVAMAVLPFVSLALYKTIELPFISFGKRFIRLPTNVRKSVDDTVARPAAAP